MACAPQQAPAADDTADPCPPPAVSVGPPGGATWADGDPVDVVWGGQGGLHSDLSFTAAGLDGAVLEVVATWTDGATQWDGAARTVACEPDRCDETCPAFRSLLIGRAILEDACALVGRRLDLTVSLTDGDHSAQSTVSLVAQVSGPSFNDPCP